MPVFSKYVAKIPKKTCLQNYKFRRVEQNQNINLAFFRNICSSFASSDLRSQKMDRRLFEAAQTGNVEYLHELINDDPLLLYCVSLSGGHNPLHVASIVGHLNFVKEILKLRTEFARELNQDGLSPLHIASANGYVEIVKEILKVDHNLCLVRGSEGRVPLHYATIKGRTRVTHELLVSSPDSVDEKTARGETALHLAIKNNQFEVLMMLVDHLKEFEKEVVLNKKDGQGNTILHLAVSRKQYEVVDLLLGQNSKCKAAIEVNSLNKHGLTPLDTLILIESEAGDREIEEILTKAGALRASSGPNPLLEQPSEISQNDNDPENEQQSQEIQGKKRSPYNQLLDYFKYNNTKDSPSETRNVLLVISILIVTATYEAILSPPGGVWQDDSTGTEESRTAGKAVMGSKNVVAYGMFMLFNSSGFFLSVHMIYVLTSGFPLQMELQISLFVLVVTYDTCMNAIAPNSSLSTFFTVISIVFPILIPFVTYVVRDYVRRPRILLPGGNC